jgi:hypothetical protein
LGTVVGSATLSSKKATKKLHESYKRAYIGFAKVDGKFEVGTE